MAGEVSRENGKKGGRPKGTNAKEIEYAKAQLIQAYIDNIKPINEALIEKAKLGDMQAMKELHDRVYGRALQPTDLNLKGELKISFDPAFNSKTNS